MIIMLMGGGLGNQMFQYALGRHLSIKNNQQLKLDTRRFLFDVKPDTYNNIRIFGLDNFNITGEIAPKKRNQKHYKYYQNNSHINRLLSKINKIRFLKSLL